MKRILLILLAAACLNSSGLSFAQTKIDLSKQKGVVPIVNGGTGNSGQQTVIQSPTNMNFGTVQTATPSPAKSLAITIGNVPVTISSVVFSGSTDFTSGGSSAPTGCNGLQAAGATCVLPVSFTPSSAVLKTGLITITSDAPLDTIAPDTVSLSGTGIGAVTFPLTIAGDPSGLGAGEFSSDETPPLIDGLFTAGAQAGGDYSNNYATGSVVRLTANPSDGGTAIISGGGCSSNPCDVTVTAATTVTVKFVPPVPNVNLSLAGGVGTGGGNVTSNVADANGILSCLYSTGVISSAGNSGCSGTFPQNKQIILTEVPRADSIFVGWSGACSGTATTCPISLDSSQTATARFDLSSTTANLSLSQARGNASVSGATIALNLLGAQTAGNTNVCAVSWGDNTTTVSSITDTGANTYTKVTGASSTTSGLSQSIYYAQNITAAAAGARTITATLSTSGASAVGFTSLTSAHNNGTSTTYASASVTLPNNQPILATTWGQLNSGNGPGAVLTMTGGSVTWVLVQALNFNSTQGTDTTTRMETWRAMGTGATGAITSTWNQAVVGRGMTITAISGADLSGTNASGAIVGAPSTNLGAGTSGSVSMGAFGSASNGTYAVFATGASNTRTAGSGMTLAGADGLVADEFSVGNQATPSMTFGSSQAWGGIGIEILASGGSASRRDLRCGEYAGIVPTGSPVDISAVAVGSSAAPASGSMTTLTANDLLVGFTASVGTSVNTASTNFTQRLENTFGDDLEDRQGVAIGAYNFQPALTASSGWIASHIAFKAASAGGGGTSNVSVTAQANGNGNGTTISNVGSPNLNCAFIAGSATPASQCGSSIISGSNVRFTAIPQAGSVFTGWLGFGCSSSPICDVSNLTVSGTIRATFTLSGTQAYYVSPSGNNGNAGTAASPWHDLSYAISHANLTNAATIHAAAGTYAELIGCGSRSAALCINRSGASPTQRFRVQCDVQWSVPSSSGCLLRNSSAAAGVQITANNVDVVGFDYSNTTHEAGIVPFCNAASGQCPTGNSVHIIDNYLHDLATDHCPAFGAIFGGSQVHGTAFQTDLQVIGNRIQHYGDTATYPRNGGTCNLGHGIYISNGNTLIEGNVIVQVPTYGIQYYSSPCGGSISNNTIDQAGKGNIVIGGGFCNGGVGSTGTITIDNNIMESAPSGGITLGAGGTSPCTASTRIKVSNNLVASGSATSGNLNGCTDVSGTVTEAPTTTFTGYSGSSATNAYPLKVGSAAIGGGTAACVSGGVNPCTPPQTFIGAGMPSPPDIGAY